MNGFLLKRIIKISVIVIVVAAAGVGLLNLTFVQEHPLVKETAHRFESVKTPLPPSVLHYYNEPAVSLENIHIRALYLVPQDAQGSIPEGWPRMMATALSKLADFHHTQFGEASRVTFSLLEKPVVITDDVFNVLPAGIERAERKDISALDDYLKEHVYSSRGEYYDGEFGVVPENTFMVDVLFLEAAGAVGGNGFVLLARDYVTDPDIFYGMTFLYHEFGHALGMPDRYIYEAEGAYQKGEVLSQDIMGGGRYRPLELTHIDDSIKAAMGIAQQ